MFPINIYSGGAVESGPMGSTYSKPPTATHPAPDDMSFEDLKQFIYQKLGIDAKKNDLSISARWNAGTAGSYWFVPMPVADESGWRMVVDNTVSGYTKWNMVELFVDPVPKVGANSKNTPGSKGRANPRKTVAKKPPPVSTATVMNPRSSQVTPATPLRSKKLRRNPRREVNRSKSKSVGSDKEGSGDGENDDSERSGEETDEDDLPVDFELPKYSARRSQGPPARFFKDAPDMQSAIADCLFSDDGKGRPPPEPNPADSCLYKGRVFTSLDHLKWVVMDYHIRENRTVLTAKAGSTLYVLKCEHYPECRWRLSAVPTADKVSFRIRYISGPHTCSNEEERTDHRNLTSNLIAKMIRNVVRENLETSPKDIQEIVNNEYPFSLSYNKAYRAKQKAIEHLFGEWKESYTLLGPLFKSIEDSNPGTKVNFWSDQTEDPKVSVLRGVSWAFAPAVDGFPHCRPVIGIDSAVLSGKYGGRLLVVVAYDAEGQLLPLAFAVVETENDESWGWFMRWLRREVVGPRPLCVISDRQDYILKLFDQPDSGWFTGAGEAYHRYCSRHLCDSFQAVFKKEELVDLVKWALKQNQRGKFQMGMTHLLQTNREAYDWLVKIGTKPSEESAYHVWAQCEDGGRRYGIMTTNGPECLDNMFKGICELPISAMVELTFHKSVNYFAGRKEEISKIQTDKQFWSNKIMAVLEARKAKSGTHEITGVGPGMHEVKTKTLTVNSRQKGGVKHVVMLEQRSCGCQKPQLTGVPCSHMLAICAFGAFNSDQFVDEMYSVKRLLATWALPFHPFQNSEECSAAGEYTGIVYKPYVGPKKRGRWKKSKGILVGSLGPVNHCSLCGQIGHNKKRCKKITVYDDGASTSHNDADLIEEGRVDIGLILDC